MIESKVERYNGLVDSRKTCSLCKSELCNPAKVKGYGKFDTEIGPWSRWQGSLNASLMIVGQDWGHIKDLQEKYFRTEHEDQSSATNIHLRDLLNGIHATERPLDSDLLGRNGELFFTNAVLCLKGNDIAMQGHVNPDWFNNCVGEKKFLRQQIEIVNPRIVVGLGRLAFSSILRSFNLDSRVPPSMKFSEIVQDKEGVKLPRTRAKAFGVYHCGAAGWNINRSEEEHRRDWERIRDALESVK